MQKIVVVPKDAEVIPSENGHAFLAGVLLKVTAFWMRRIIKIMGERPAVVAVFRLSCGELPGILDKAAEEKPAADQGRIGRWLYEKRAEEAAEEPTEIVELPAVKEAERAAASWSKTLAAPVKPSSKAAKKPLKKVLRPSVAAAGGAEK